MAVVLNVTTVLVLDVLFPIDAVVDVSSVLSSVKLATAVPGAVDIIVTGSDVVLSIVEGGADVMFSVTAVDSPVRLVVGASKAPATGDEVVEVCSIPTVSV